MIVLTKTSVLSNLKCRHVSSDDRRRPTRFLFNPFLCLFDVDSSEKTVKEYDFAEILKKSICLEQSTQAWCENCEKYQPTVSTSGRVVSMLAC